MANRVEPDQTAPIGAVCSRSTLFAPILYSSVIIGNFLQQTTSADDIFRCIFFLGALKVNFFMARAQSPVFRWHRFITQWQSPDILFFTLLDQKAVECKNESDTMKACHKFAPLFIYMCTHCTSKTKWTAAWYFQQCGILTGVDSDKPLQPPFELRNSKWCLVSSLIFIEYASD